MRNNFISPRGVEFCREEVLQLLAEKEARYWGPQFDKRLKELASQAIDHTGQITGYQDLIWHLLKARTTDKIA